MVKKRKKIENHQTLQTVVVRTMQSGSQQLQGSKKSQKLESIQKDSQRYPNLL